MKTIKIIDLLNKIANDEIKEGFKVKLGKDIYEYKKGLDYFRCVGKEYCDYGLGAFTRLNEEIEIIEEEKKSEVKEIQKIKSKRFSRNQKQIAGKINELIDAVNELKGKSE